MFAKLKLRKFLPGENTGLILIATFIGLTAGLAIIVFRSVVELVHAYIFELGHELLRIDEGGWRCLLLPLLPIRGMSLLMPL
jgi:CIC family chloride channel protein